MKMLIALAVAAAAAPVLAQPTAPVAPPLAAMPAPVDPARLAVARQTVDYSGRSAPIKG